MGMRINDFQLPVHLLKRFRKPLAPLSGSFPAEQ
jgi:hypothetical protein